jgi:exosortase/archaeosortase family protein
MQRQARPSDRQKGNSRLNGVPTSSWRSKLMRRRKGQRSAPSSATRFLTRVLLGWLGAVAILALFPAIEQVAVRATVWTLWGVLTAMSLHPVVSGAAVSSWGVSVEIVEECTPLLPAVVYGVAVLSYPARPRAKLFGIAAGITVLWIYNILRLIALYGVLVWQPRFFDLVHLYFWQTLTFVVLCGLFILWLWAQ